MRRIIMSALAVFALVAVAWAAEPKLDGVKCCVNPKANAKAEKSADYKGGKVFFCCDNCPKAFAANPEKFAVNANAQLVLTGQAKQVKCPISGKDVNTEVKAVKVHGVDVQFCCENCQGKVIAAKDDAGPLVFSDAAFAKGFKVEAAK